MTALGREPAERRRDVLGTDSRRLEDALALDALGDGGTGGEGRAAALGVEGRRPDPPALHGDRDADQVAARRAPGRAREAAHGDGPAPARVTQIVLECL